jgi:hypothetical protein
VVDYFSNEDETRGSSKFIYSLTFPNGVFFQTHASHRVTWSKEKKRIIKLQLYADFGHIQQVFEQNRQKN